ncbi:hypothetical protein IGI04_032965 [Brassica rapa subsp. trilocularis]|uniref:Coenzyme Q-binding protein COQ10 START domain-containing protein n=1 Tax=Brassica rapa subsp. trilocularis TaxID=1813537 RepID=A0ABQ7L4J7_BRACM|nr:hypothetical protein IGI04_032965 [Brassica rapa subsp. trilocularis]
MQIVSDFSSAFPHPRAAALATTSTSSISISQSPAIKFHSTNVSPSSSLLLASSSSSRRCFTCRFDNNSPRFDSSDGDYYNETESDDCLTECLADGKTEDGVVIISVEKLEKSSRRIRSKVGIEASLDAVWSVLTDYEKLSEFIPGLVVSELVEKEGNRVRLFQMGQQSIALGLKFNAKAVLDCFEKELEILPHGRRREIDFKMVEGDFQLFEGKWSIEQLDKGEASDLQFKDFPTTLAYTVDVKPKMWLPVRLVEGRLCNEIKTNLLSVRDAAQKVIENVIHDL